MRVIFVTHNYPRHAGDLAGAFLHPLAVALRERDLDVRIVAPSDAGRGGEDLRDGVPVRRVRYARPEEERLAYTGRMTEALVSPRGILAFFRLRRALEQGALDLAAGASDVVVHAHWWIPGGWAAPSRLPLVLTSHGTDVRLLGLSWIARALARPVYGRARVVTAVSRHLATAIGRTVGRTVDQDHVQPMPVDTSAWRWSEGGSGVLVVARLTPQKRVHLVLQALARLRAAGRPTRCTVVGDGSARAELERLAGETGVANDVEFSGALPFPAVLDRLARADLAVLPAVAEGFGLAGAEALMSGVPIVICRDGGGLLDLAEPGASRVVDPTADALATAIADLLDDPAASATARRVGEAWKERLAPAHVAGRFEEWYREALHA